MNNKKKNGFTLIELLITISLMLSLLGIAIVSFISISNRKKQQAYEAVQKQAETAGEQFFDTNLYMFEGLAVNGTSGVITIGKLVSEDYLNVVTDPRTGKKINKCDYIQVTRTNSGYKTKYVEATATSCPETLNTVVVQEAGAPGITISVSGTEGNNGWYKSRSPEEYANVKTNGNGPITEIKRCLKEGSSCVPDSPVEIKSGNEFKTKSNSIGDTKTSTISYKATNSSGKSAIATIDVKVDTVAPDCNSYISNTVPTTGWYNKNSGAPQITLSATDTLSGINGNSSVKPSISEGKNISYSHQFKDNAGNTQTCSKTASYDKTAPVCSVTAGGLRKNEWYRGQVNLSVSGTDALSGIDPSTYSLNGTSGKTAILDTNTNEKGLKVFGFVHDNAGNNTSCSKTLNIENTLPKCGSNNGKSYWTNDSELEITQHYTSLSGNGSVKSLFTFGKGEVKKTGKIEITSPAGNVNTCEVNLYIDKKAPTFDLEYIIITQYKNNSSITKSKKFIKSGERLLLENFAGTYGPSETSVKNLKDCNNDGIDCSGVDENSKNTVFVAERNNPDVQQCLDHDSNKKCHYNQAGYAPCDSALKYCVKDKAGNETCKSWDVDARYYKSRSQGDYPGICTDY